jgi:hypothetical protein
MRRRVGVVIGFDLHDDAADAIDQESRANQIGRHLMHAPIKKSFSEQFAGFRATSCGFLEHGWV